MWPHHDTIRLTLEKPSPIHGTCLLRTTGRGRGRAEKHATLKFYNHELEKRQRKKIKNRRKGKRQRSHLKHTCEISIRSAFI